MMMLEHVTCIGASGKHYIFEVFTKSSPLSEAAGIYIATYSHPRGHLSGFQVNVLQIFSGLNIEADIDELRENVDLAEQCWNYTCVLFVDDDWERQAILKDLQNKCTIQT